MSPSGQSAEWNVKILMLNCCAISALLSLERRDVLIYEISNFIWLLMSVQTPCYFSTHFALQLSAVSEVCAPPPPLLPSFCSHFQLQRACKKTSLCLSSSSKVHLCSQCLKLKQKARHQAVLPPPPLVPGTALCHLSFASLCNEFYGWEHPTTSILYSSQSWESHISELTE